MYEKMKEVHGFTKGNIHEGSVQFKKISEVEKKHVIQLDSKEHPSPSATISDHPGTSMDVGNNPNISSNDLDELQRQADSLLTKVDLCSMIMFPLSFLVFNIT
uniref:Uncharacterized protein n=1 Tax=Acrobeloides nanus TaxID=290746 RepID=A0A914CM91_9BILA